MLFTIAYPEHQLGQQVRNEIAVLKRVSAGHPNICRLVDHFETAHNLYLVFDLCTGGELFDRICSKGNYYERYVPRGVLNRRPEIMLIPDAVGTPHKSSVPSPARSSTFTTKVSSTEVRTAMIFAMDYV